MNHTLIILGSALAVALLGISAEAACGGGGYNPSETASTQKEAPRESTRQDERESKLEGLQRDIDKAQAKFDRCVGDCDKERRKLAEARAKYAKKAGEI